MAQPVLATKPEGPSLWLRVAHSSQNQFPEAVLLLMCTYTQTSTHIKINDAETFNHIYSVSPRAPLAVLKLYGTHKKNIESFTLV